MKKLLFIASASVGLLFSCNAPDCTNGEQDGNETGVDCGGDCPPCPPPPPPPPNNTSPLNPSLTYGSVTDIDGNEYATIQIGNQEWMAENLRTTKYCNGDPIPNITDNNQWYNLTSGAWAHYNNNSQYENLYGKLYNWYAVDDSRNICPCNWHVPTDAEWTVLTEYLGGVSVAGGKMKSIGTQYWANPNTDATNESGFSGLPGGYRAWSGAFIEFGQYGFWWSSTESVTDDARYRSLSCYGGSVYRYTHIKAAGFSVRCLRD